ncbi:MAG: alpha/beta hydrolase [Paracoccaceae bacterium]
MIGGTFLLIVGLLLAIPFAIEELRTRMNAERRKDAAGQFVTLSKGVTYYDWLGPARGPVAVCVHGLTTPSFVWRGLARGLALMGYRVLIYDLYGRGYSDRPKGKQDTGFFLDQLDELLADQGVTDEITLIGYSMGGAIATSFAAQNPGKIRQLILIAPAGFEVARSHLMNFAINTPFLGDWLMLSLFPLLHRIGTAKERKLPSSVENIVELKQAELKLHGFTPAVLASMRGVLASGLEKEHKSIRRAGIPVLAVWGREDDVIPLSAVGSLAEWSRKARQEVVDSAGHGLVYTHTDEVLNAMRETLRDGLN